MKAKKTDKQKITSTLARSSDRSLEINFTIPVSLIEEEEGKVLENLAKETSISGFRKGKAPLNKVRSQIPEATLREKTLVRILPRAFSQAIREHKIRPAMYPKFELIKKNGTWQVRAKTCELPEVNLGDYKKAIRGTLRTTSIWTPGQDKKKDSPAGKRGLSKEEKEQEVIKILLKTIKIGLPKILIDEEVNARLASLLQRIEKLGLSLESYLSSTGKTGETLRQEYEEQVKQSISLEIILNAIADAEKVAIEEKQVTEIIEAAAKTSKDAEKFERPEQRNTIRAVLKRKAVLEQLANL